MVNSIVLHHSLQPTLLGKFQNWPFGAKLGKNEAQNEGRVGRCKVAYYLY